MKLKNIHIILNIIIDHKLTTTEISIFQDAILLSESKNDFVLNRYHLRFKSSGKSLTQQAIFNSISSLEQKGILERIGKHENFIQHKISDRIFNV